WPRWTLRVDGQTGLEHEILVEPGNARVLLVWRLHGESPGARTLCVRPLLSGRDPHALHRENAAFRFDAEPTAGGIAWRPYDGVPSTPAAANGAYTHDPVWYRSFQYDEERARGLDFVEDLAAPGIFRFDLAQGEAVLVLGTEPTAEAAEAVIGRARAIERARR